MKIRHICAGWEETNGAAVIARLVAHEQESSGACVRFATWVGIRELRAADEVWTHCGWLPVLWWAGLFARRLVRMPEACYDPVRLRYHGWKKMLVKPIERFFLRRAKKVVATCAAEADWIRAYEPKAHVEIIDVKRYFNLSRRGILPRQNKDVPLHVLYLGRRHPLKGVEYLEKAVKRTNGECKIENAKWTEDDRVELRIESDLRGEAKEAAWTWCDVLCLPTLSENFGLVVAEALSRGKRVITTDGAPAWENEPGVVYLKGYREGTDERRVELLARALSEVMR